MKKQIIETLDNQKLDETNKFTKENPLYNVLLSDYQDNEEHLEAYRREMRKRYLDKIPLLNNNKNHTKYCKTLDVVENYTIRTAMSRTLDFKEELMSVVWHPRNIDKFKYLDPDLFTGNDDSDEDSC